jgi:23S rRNA (cytidine1920-2'-O)/16S rRNA (cytidine1409-2'-O)-methyltransferase
VSKRLDLVLVERGLANSRTHAQELIEAGQIFLIQGSQRKKLSKASFSVSADDQIDLESGPANRFVSRGGLKLEGALKFQNISVQGLKILDVGISTGGFTDCLLQSGAEKVVGVDVGHGQVNPKLLSDSRLQVFEGINARALSQNAEVKAAVPEKGFDLAVMDVSFISITLILPELPSLLASGGMILSLVKPQFEVGVDGLGKGGIVKDVRLYGEVEKKIRTACEKCGLEVKAYFDSPIEGKDGNREFFVLAKKR